MANQNSHVRYASIYPTMDSPDDVLKWAATKLPITTKHELASVLMTYHNTLLKEIQAHGLPQGK